MQRTRVGVILYQSNKMTPNSSSYLQEKMGKIKHSNSFQITDCITMYFYLAFLLAFVINKL